MANALSDYRPRRSLGFAGQEGEMMDLANPATQNALAQMITNNNIAQPMNTIRTSSGEYLNPQGMRSNSPVEFGASMNRPQFQGSPVDVFGQGKGYMNPATGMIEGVNQQGQRFRVQPEGTAAAQHQARLAAEDRALKLAQERQKLQLGEQALMRNEQKMNAPQRQTPLSATAQKELFEADDFVNASRTVKDLLNSVISVDPRTGKSLNERAYSGLGASTRATGMSWLPGESDAANATKDLDNIMSGQALESLKSTFGGNPTEGERAILLDLQASSSKTPQQRASIIKRAIAAADRREKTNAAKAKAIRGGTYFTESPQSDNGGDGGDDLDKLLELYK